MQCKFTLMYGFKQIHLAYLFGEEFHAQGTPSKNITKAKTKNNSQRKGYENNTMRYSFKKTLLNHFVHKLSLNYKIVNGDGRNSEKCTS